MPYLMQITAVKFEQHPYGTIFSLVTHGFHAEAMIRLKAKYLAF